MKELIRRKRDGEALAPEEIDRWIHGVVDGSVPDYQSAALLMAITLRGMTRAETIALTEAMLRSGRVLEWSRLGRPTVDKHSTGGVGDKVSLALAPWVAACGAVIPMIAGRGLGHTGGTLDKLEAIPGFRVKLSIQEFTAQLERLGLVIAGQTADLVPADRELYALRDVTATVESIPLIVASILSKKFASGTEAVVFDVKRGGGAFMRTADEARALARELVDVSLELGRRGYAVITSMEQPLGQAIGNANETAEAFALLHGKAPADLMEVTRELAVRMLLLAKIARERNEAEARLDRVLESGEAVRKAEAWVQAQGGDPRAVSDPSTLPRAEEETPVPAPRSGHVVGIDARALGTLLVAMRGGRARKEDPVDPAVGIRLLAKRGDAVREGEPMAIVDAH
ncbi:MAG TPA: thymidine phosphorylase, partial [Candidatus Eisenbacteria bacterium]|nr:thymidine phosphorylase [Candidatus Eisenbacteria bacterium]